MARRSATILPIAFLAGALISGSADARDRSLQDSPQTPIAEASPTLAPFQHVRFCLRYPSDCKSDPAENKRIDLTAEKSELLASVNRSVNDGDRCLFVLGVAEMMTAQAEYGNLYVGVIAKGTAGYSR